MKPTALVLALAAALPAIALAQEAGPALTLSGYGTLGVVRSSDRTADFLADAFKPNGPGATRGTSADVDSRLGVQLSLAITRQLSAVVQGVSQQRYDNSYRPTVEWANLKWQPTPDLAIRAGRIVLPIFLVNDSRKVGYANPWVRPPVEVYSLVPVTTSDGMDASARFTVADITGTLQAAYGVSKSKFPGTLGFGVGEAHAEDLLAVVGTLERGAATARVSWGRARLTIDAFDPLFDAYRQFGPPGEAIAARFAVDDAKVDFLGLGLSWDPGPWFAMAEWARFDTRSVIGKRSAWYVSGGWRAGAFTPYATVARLKSDGPTSDPGLAGAPGFNAAFLPPQAAAVVPILDANLNGALAAIAVQRTMSLGVRWDFARNLALKLQFDRVKRGPGSPGTFGNPGRGFEPGGSASLASASLDVVF